MKCQATSDTSHDVLISKEIDYKSYKEICSGEKKKVNLGFNNEWNFRVENNSLEHTPERNKPFDFFDEKAIFGEQSQMPYDWEILSKFLSTHNIEPNWLDCNGTYGWYDEDLGSWTGCIGKV